MRFIAALLLIGFSITTSAHHSRAEFSEEVEEITGELVSVNWTNPHPTFTVNVLTDGEEEQWDILAYDSLYGLTRAFVQLTLTSSPGISSTVSENSAREW